MRVERDVDLMGYKRGAHEEGELVCAGFEVKQKPDPGVWGWNDLGFMNCSRCSRAATEHVVVQSPVIQLPKKTAPATAPPASLGTEGLESLRLARAKEAARTQTGLVMLDEMHDPLAVNARPAVPKPVERPDETAVQPRAPALVPHGPAVVEPESRPEPTVAMLLAREKAFNDAFKEEVEQMIRESLAIERRQALEDEISQRAPAAAHTLKSPPAAYSDAAVMLEALGLTQYAATFAREAVDPSSLREVMAAQGRTALDEVLKELGVASMGHRIKITNAMC